MFYQVEASRISAVAITSHLALYISHTVNIF